MSDLRPVVTPRRVNVRSVGYVAKGHPEGLTVQLYETGTPEALRMQQLDEAHERNEGGEHRPGFCRPCADNYVEQMDAT